MWIEIGWVDQLTAVLRLVTTVAQLSLIVVQLRRARR
jgi:hypothetical protein